MGRVMRRPLVPGESVGVEQQVRRPGVRGRACWSTLTSQGGGRWRREGAPPWVTCLLAVTSTCGCHLSLPHTATPLAATPRLLSLMAGRWWRGRLGRRHVGTVSLLLLWLTTLC